MRYRQLAQAGRIKPHIFESLRLKLNGAVSQVRNEIWGAKSRLKLSELQTAYKATSVAEGKQLMSHLIQYAAQGKGKTGLALRDVRYIRKATQQDLLLVVKEQDSAGMPVNSTQSTSKWQDAAGQPVAMAVRPSTAPEPPAEA